MPSYWLLDPGIPALCVLELVDGAYADAGHVQGPEALVVERPSLSRIVPADLLR